MTNNEIRRRKASRSPSRGRPRGRTKRPRHEQVVAVVKRIPITFSQQEEARWRSEMNYIRRSSKTMACHPYTLGYSGARESEDSTHIELFRGVLRGNIYGIKEAGMFPLSEVVDATCRSMLKALRHLAASGIVHRDVRPENILYEEDGNGDITLKLANFGLRVDTGGGSCPNPCNNGIDPYRAPEAWSLERQSHASDMWSLFATLCELAGQYNVEPYHRYYQAWEELYKIATTQPRKGMLDLRGVKEAIIWEPAFRATAAQLIAKFYDVPGLKSDERHNDVPDLVTWDKWVARVGDPAVVDGLYKGKTHPWILLADNPSGQDEEPQAKAKKKAPVKTEKHVIKHYLPKLDGIYTTNVRNGTEAAMKQAIQAEIRKVIKEEIRQCQDPAIKKALKRELAELSTRTSESAGLQGHLADAKLEQAIASRDSLQDELERFQKLMEVKDDNIASLMKELQEQHQKKKEGDMLDFPVEDAYKRELAEANEARDSCEARLQEAVGARAASEARAQMALKDKEYIRAKLENVLASRDELKAKVLDLEEAIRIRDNVIQHRLETCREPKSDGDDTAAPELAEMEEHLQEALTAREASVAEMAEAIEARNALKSELRDALESRDQLKMQLSALETQKAGAASSPHAATSVDEQIRFAMQEKDKIEQKLQKVAMDRLATEAKLKDAVGARGSAEEQIRNSKRARETAEAALQRVQDERDALRAQVTKKTRSGGDGEGQSQDTEEPEGPMFTYRMDPAVERKHRYFSCSTNTLRDLRHGFFLGDEGLDLAGKRRRIITEFGGPSSSTRQKRFNDFMSGSSGNRQVRILC